MVPAPRQHLKDTYCLFLITNCQPQLVVFEVWGKIRVYPNTVNELTELELEMPLFENSQIAVTDNLGNVVAETVLLAGRRNVHVDLSSLESGEYVVQLQTSADNRQFSLVITN